MPDAQIAGNLILEGLDLLAKDKVPALENAVDRHVHLVLDFVVCSDQVERRDLTLPHDVHFLSSWFSSSWSSGTFRKTCAGLPATMTRAGTSCVTTDPAATIPCSSTVRPGRIVALTPMRPPRLTVTPLKCLKRSLPRAM